MKTIVVTGSTRGIGFGMAQHFLKRGCKIVVSGRSQQSVDAALAKLQAHAKEGHLTGHPCDVGDEAQVQALWHAAVNAFGTIDIWINNAALGTDRELLWEQDASAIQNVINANIMGTINGCNVALRGMKEQGHGHIYNFRGFGSGGETMNGMIPYGLTKATVAYITKALQKEAKDLPVHISSISPGIVVTDLLMQSIDPDNRERSERFFNILGDTVETVTPWLADQVLANEKGGAYINWLPPHKIAGRFLMSPFRKRQPMSQANS